MAKVAHRPRKALPPVLSGALALGAFGLAAMLVTGCSNPARYGAPWCTNFADGGVNECSYRSYEQCMGTVSGVGGICTRNPSYVVDAPAARKRMR